FEVVDLGVNQPSETILKKAQEVNAELVGVSALMTTSMPRMKEVIHAAESKGIKTNTRFIVGGAPVTEQYAKEIGSDGTAGDASGAVRLAQRLVGGT
ncbi:MAG: cobalamin-dependent protein, partial [Candidatus Thermoplasmatota archaeon]